MLLTNEIMEEMDAGTQREVLEAMLDELTERRGVRDPELFKRCFIEEADVVAIIAFEVARIAISRFVEVGGND